MWRKSSAAAGEMLNVRFIHFWQVKLSDKSLHDLVIIQPLASFHLGQGLGDLLFFFLRQANRFFSFHTPKGHRCFFFTALHESHCSAFHSKSPFTHASMKGWNFTGSNDTKR